SLNKDAGSPVPRSQVGDARRLYRTGESEYLLNKSVCRLRDVQDLFAGTGVNPKAYALMDQDRLNHVLTAKPWERRIFIEEAAGGGGYKQERSEKQGKPQAAPRNLQRGSAGLDEEERQAGSPRRQARASGPQGAAVQGAPSGAAGAGPRHAGRGLRGAHRGPRSAPSGGRSPPCRGGRAARDDRPALGPRGHPARGHPRKRVSARRPPSIRAEVP